MPEGRAFDDPADLRAGVYDSVQSAISAVPPVKVGNFSLGLSDVAYADPPDVTPHERKRAILRNETLARRLRGTLTLSDQDNNPISQSKVTIARVPKPTDDGTMVLNGVEWTLGNQLRLKPGVYVRRTNAGEVEAHANVAQGSGPVHHYYIDPKSGVFKLRVGQANVNLAPVLKRLGATDADLDEAWGPELAQSNRNAKGVDPIAKLFDKMGPKQRPGMPQADPVTSVLAAFQRMRYDPKVTNRTLGTPFEGSGYQTILAATKKLLAVRQGKQDPDDRDAMVYQNLHGPEDLIAERATKQLPGVLRKFAFKAATRKNLDHVTADFFGPEDFAAMMSTG